MWNDIPKLLRIILWIIKYNNNHFLKNVLLYDQVYCIFVNRLLNICKVWYKTYGEMVPDSLKTININLLYLH